MSEQDTRALSATSGAAKKRKRIQREEDLKKTNRKITDYVPKKSPKNSAISPETKKPHSSATCSTSSEKEDDSRPCTSKFHCTFFLGLLT